ncbi:MAG: polyphosphate polymerase domain-containing protein [Acidimicrobiales bacterium]|jgi:hypothetical protein
MDELDRFATVSLDELDSVRLMDRAETKVLMPASELAAVLRPINGDYRTLRIDGQALQGYRTSYFDSASFRTYHDHHNQLGRRFKIRYRTYVGSDVTFFEVKRSVHGRIVKERKPSTAPTGHIHEDDRAFARACGVDIDGFVPSVTVEYQRILLARFEPQERVTIDLHTSFGNGTTSAATDGLAILEFKQPRVDRNSPAIIACRKAGLRPRRMSKYCTAVAACERGIRRNRFLPVFRHLELLGVRVTDCANREVA